MSDSLRTLFTNIAWFLLISFLLFTFFRIIYQIINQLINNQKENINTNQNKNYITKIILIILIIIASYYFGFEKEYIIQPDSQHIKTSSDVNYDNLIGKYIITIELYTSFESLTVYVSFYTEKNELITTNEVNKINIDKTHIYKFEFHNTSIFTHHVKLEKIVGIKKGLIQFIT